MLSTVELSPDVLKDLVKESVPARRVYGTLMRMRARWTAQQGRSTDTLHLLLRAWRGVGPERFGATGVRWVHKLIEDRCYDHGRLRPVQGNALLAEFVASAEGQAIRREFASYPLPDRVRLRFPRDEDDPERQGDLIILKSHDPATGERGVLLVTYTEAIRRLPAILDLRELASRYRVVLEPSSWGYEDSTFLFYLGADLDVLVQCPWRRDYHFISSLNANLVATRVGAGDWVDPAVFRAGAEGERTYDLVVVSSWNPIKRHRDLFRSLAILKARGRTLRVALIGYPSTWTREHIEALAHRYGVADCCTIFEAIPHEEVARIVADSRAYVLLSRREGANRALYEALFCDTPVIVYKGHHGVNTDHVNDQVGVLFEDGSLDEAVLRVLDGPRTFHPREWALANTGWENATDKINQALRSMAVRRGEPWTRDIAPKKMAPNLRYAIPGHHREFAEEYERLGAYLLPV